MPLKVAMWALGILVLSLFGVVIINLFGNITVTDQLNYTTMKNAVEASMYDALDVAHYRTGFCLCTNVAKTSGKWSFNDDSEYELLDITYENDKEKCVSTKTNCEILYGEYRINGKVFTESLVRRFAEMVNNNKDYELVIQDIIEYPPKVSVRINSKDTEFSRTEKNSGGYTIVNQMDAIIETKTKVAATPTPIPQEAPTPTPEPDKVKVTTHHYIKGTTTKVYKDQENSYFVGDAYNTNSIASSKLNSSYKNKYSWNGTTPSNAKGKVKESDLKNGISVTYYYENVEKHCYMRHKDKNYGVADDLWSWTDEKTIVGLNKSISDKALKWMIVESVKKESDCHCHYGWIYTSEKTTGRQYRTELNNKLKKEGKLHSPPQKGDVQWDAYEDLGNGNARYTKFVYGCASESKTTGCTWHYVGMYKADNGLYFVKTGGSYSSCAAAFSACKVLLNGKPDYSCMGVKNWGVYNTSTNPNKRVGSVSQSCTTSDGKYKPEDPCAGKPASYKCVCGG